MIRHACCSKTGEPAPERPGSAAPFSTGETASANVSAATGGPVEAASCPGTRPPATADNERVK